MSGRKRTVQVKFYVTEDERKLIEEKMKLYIVVPRLREKRRQYTAKQKNSRSGSATALILRFTAARRSRKSKQ